TYGRGFWILDDITPLRELAAGVPNARAHLFGTRETYRFRDAESPFAIFDDPANGQIPPYGAALTYWIRQAPNDTARGARPTRADIGRDTVIAAAKRDTTKADTTKRAVPNDSVTITIADAAGTVVRTMKGPVESGLNRVW